MNLRDLAAAVNLRTGVGVSEDALYDVVNEALAKVSRVQDWPWLEQAQAITALEDTDDYTLDLDARRIVSVTVNGFETLPVAPVEMDAWDEEGISLRRIFAVEGGTTLSLRPTPTEDDPIVVRYIANEPRLTAATQTPLLPDAYSDVLIDGASSMILERVGELARADRAANRFDAGVKEMVKGARHNRTGPFRVRSTSYDGI